MKKLTFLALALSFLIGTLSTAVAQVQVPCDPCIIDPCKLAPERCADQGGPVK